MILITAATGQVGSEALNALVAAGTEVRALVRDPCAFEAPEGVQVVQCDFDDDTSMAKALKEVGVMLLAATPDAYAMVEIRPIAVKARLRLAATTTSSIACQQYEHDVEADSVWQHSLTGRHIEGEQCRKE